MRRPDGGQPREAGCYTWTPSPFLGQDDFVEESDGRVCRRFDFSFMNELVKRWQNISIAVVVAITQKVTYPVFPAASWYTPVVHRGDS